MGKKKPGQKKPQGQAMSLDDFNKATPASFTTKTDNFHSGVYKNLNMEALPSVMANENKQKKVFAHPETDLGPPPKQHVKGDVEIVSYEEATGSRMSDNLGFATKSFKPKEEKKEQQQEADGWETVGQKKKPEPKKQSSDPYKMAPNKLKQTAQQPRAPGQLPPPTAPQAFVPLPQPSPPVFAPGGMPMPPMPMAPMGNMPMPPMPGMSQPQVESKSAPLTLDQVMGNLAQKGQEKLQAKQQKEQQQLAYREQNAYDHNPDYDYDYGNEEGYNRQEEHPDPFVIQNMGQEQLSSALNQLSLNPGLLGQMNGDQMSMFNNLKNHMGGGGNLQEFVPSDRQQQEAPGGYNPVYFVEDHEAHEGVQGEQVILQPDSKGGFQEVGKYNTFGTGQNHPASTNFGGMTREQLEAMQHGDEEIPDDDDARIEQYLQSNAEKVYCQFFLAGSCNKGEQCRFMHPTSLQGQKTIRPYDKKDDTECQVCMELVLRAGRQFGLLDGCDHIFCLKCIRSWRATYDKKIGKHHYRTCPICRANSYLVIPSFYVYRTSIEKDDLIDDYKLTLGDMDCRHFQKGSGRCPFLNSCLYAHRLPDGSEYEYDKDFDQYKYNEFGEQIEDIEETLGQKFGL